VIRAAIYIRVSKGDGSQTTENQLPVLRQYCTSRGWDVVKVYEDNESASSPKASDRPAFRRMFTDAEAHAFDVLVFWALDRFTREGSAPTLQYLTRLSSFGVDWASYQEQYLDTKSLGPFRDAVIAILGAIAKQEALRMSERIKAGQARARMNGRRVGKPPKIPSLDYFRRADKVYNTDELQELFHCGPATIYTWRRRVRQEDAARATNSTSAA
jgi:DNA invertase Pin-like site-specific DNA recombinase